MVRSLKRHNEEFILLQIEQPSEEHFYYPAQFKGYDAAVDTGEFLFQVDH